MSHPIHKIQEKLKSLGFVHVGGKKHEKWQRNEITYILPRAHGRPGPRLEKNLDVQIRRIERQIQERQC